MIKAFYYHILRILVLFIKHLHQKFPICYKIKFLSSCFSWGRGKGRGVVVWIPQFSSNWPTGPIRSSSRDVRLFDVPFHVLDLRPILLPFPEVECPKFLEIRNPWGKVLERSGLRIEHFCWEVV